jgi:uncharacterized protein (DUF1330 family)
MKARYVVKTRYVVALAVVAGFGLGAAAIQGLHAQAKPPAYVVAEIDVTNEAAFLKDFAPLAQKALATGAGYKAIARGGKTVSLYGAPPKSRIVINTFANIDEAIKAYNSPAYKEAKAIGDKYATFRTYAIEGVAN